MLHGGRITFGGWVGLVQLGDLQIEVLPKLFGTDRIVDWERITVLEDADSIAFELERDAELDMPENWRIRLDRLGVARRAVRTG